MTEQGSRQALRPSAGGMVSLSIMNEAARLKAKPVIFGLMLFVIEPFIVGPRLEETLRSEPARALRRIEALRWILLLLSLLVIAAVVAGLNGWL